MQEFAAVVNANVAESAAGSETSRSKFEGALGLQPSRVSQIVSWVFTPLLTEAFGGMLAYCRR